MKVINTNGITYLEKFDTSEEWYWGTDYACGDLYEAEDVFLMGKRFEPNRLIFVRYPEGIVYEPIKSKENQYFGNPAYIDGKIYILLVNFEEKAIRVLQYAYDKENLVLIVEIPLCEVKDCYNLNLDASPLMLTRQSDDNQFQIIWPEKVEFTIGARESFLFRSGEKLLFSEWHEDSEYREEVNIRKYPSGELLEKIDGTVMTMPNGENLILG